MKERGILFTAPMVRAILAGTKTQTRRLMKSQPCPNGYRFDGKDILCHNDYLPPSAMLMDVKRGKEKFTVSDVEGDLFLHCPYGITGDRLWVRETCRAHEITAKEDADNRWRLGDRYGEGPNAGLDGVVFAADDSFVAIANTPQASDAWVKLNHYGGKGKGATVPGIHMPRWACRITLELLGVGFERLQDISVEDALAEGIVQLRDGGYGLPDGEHYHAADPRESYWSLFESINGPGSVEQNPHLWVLEFPKFTA